ncbi:organic solvent tolerance protein OstA [Rhodoblastus acidophilus]|uniref:Organic solvent tolerance protein OstA n=1 Tax=Candidatus Rhodoblastus alkanivorans TaxID=2954117 RepID=A0ABS9Z3D0_9HYPH|nr:LptA/OstA family protein [Candidatus Rhodoblastus alkanivorans]MCI4679728.1 organic solvent tolerance protein OstA [Candidatus Rhodoblastus alkanivorans]MCI4681966.1 organic solvent tolerance protein OstA [Candidatus Rhodoblastus alkanivorans]MDI4643016.1 organic solvent tolerance protein OstA [Rhodoblastus acidophilus]
MKRLGSRAAKAVFFAAALAAAPACAAPQKEPDQGSALLLPGASSREPIHISADKLDYFDKQQKAIYTGNVIAVQGDTRLKASSLLIFFDSKPGAAKKETVGPGAAANSGLRRMEGKGPIVITNKDQVGTGDSLLYDKPADKFYLIGHVMLSQGENVTRGDKLTYDLATGQAVVSSKGRVRSLIVPGDQGQKPGAPQPAAPARRAH